MLLAHRDVEGLELGHMMGPACVIDVTRWVGEGGDGRSAQVPPSGWRTGKTATDLCSPATSSSCTQAGTSAFARSPRAATPTRPTRSCTSGVPAGLARDVVFVELLCRLGELPPRGATFLFLPIKLRGGTGGPGRAIAFLPA